MKIDNILEEGTLVENQQVAEDTVVVIEELGFMLNDIQRVKSLIKNKSLDENAMAEISTILDEMDEVLGEEGIGVIAEKVQRQFRRYGDTFLRQYRCVGGPKAGRLVTSPEKCGKRKDPRRVRIGKKASRVKKGIRTRKTLFTKRKTSSKRLSRLNKVLRGE
jgi:hypothetical protein